MNMKKRLRGLISLWLAALMLATILPAGVLAAEAQPVFGDVTYHIPNENGTSSDHRVDHTSTVLKFSDVPFAMTPEGKHFSHWASGESSGFINSPQERYLGGEVITDTDATPSFSLHLKAFWADNTYTVVFHDGSATAEQPFTYGKEKSLEPNRFMREYTVTFDGNGGTPDQTSASTSAAFAGWATYPDGAVSYTDGQTVKNLSTEHGATVHLYAKWSDMSSIILPAATRQDHTFTGWYTASVGGTKVGNAGENYIPTDSVVLYAQWTENAPAAYTVTFDANGGSGIMTPQDFAQGTLNANAFFRDGYTFSGWNTSPDGSGISYSDSTSLTLTDDLTLYAQWTENSLAAYTVTFDANGGSGTMDSQDFAQGTLNANAFFRDGYTFSGWNTSPDGSGISYSDSTSLTLTGDLTLYAQWTENSLAVYTVTFDANGGSGIMDPQDFAQGIAKNLAVNSFTRNGYTFSGWNTKADGTGKSYTDREAAVFSENTTLYAQWKEASSGALGGSESIPEPKPTPEPEPTPEYKPDPAPVYQGSTYRPVVQNFIVTISGDEKTIMVDATLKNKIATIPTVPSERLDTVIDIHVKTGFVRIDFSKMKRELNAVNIPSAALKQIAAAASDPENDTKGIEILFADGMSITLDAAALASVVDQAKDDAVTFFFEKAEDLTELQKKTIVDQTAYDIRITSGETPISDLEGTVTIQIPYTLKDNETGENIAVSYVDEDGVQKPYETFYNNKQKSVSWVTDHLSVFMVNYRKNSSEDIYTVQKGDTLYSISQQFGCTVEDIMELNRDLLGINSQLIYEGWKLRIPVC